MHVAVKDTGIGIKQEDIAKLFVDYERIEENRNYGIEGTGLGMSITQQLLSMMGSELKVDVSRQVGCGDRAHILDEEGGIPAQHGAEADGVAAAIFFDFGLRDLLVFFVARGNWDKLVDRRIFGIRKGDESGGVRFGHSRHHSGRGETVANA